MAGRARSRVTTLLVVASALLAGCASDGNMKLSPFPAPKPTAARHPAIDPRLPALPSAGSGRGGYYLDDGPGDNPPAGLYDVPDPIVKSEVLSKYGNRPYVVFGKTYTPIAPDASFVQRGVASWYGKKFHGQRTSSGELYDMYQLSAAHPTLPIPSYARVTSLESGKSVVVRVNDRGPFHSSRIIDVSYTAALKLGLLGKGSHEVEVQRLLPEDQSRIATVRRNAAPAPASVLVAPTPIYAASLTPPPASDLVAPTRIAAPMLDDHADKENANDRAAPAASKPEAPAPATPLAADGFYLQLGAFSQVANATDARAKVLATGAVTLVDIVPAGGLHRLFGGPFATREAAQQAAATLPPGLAIKALVVRRTTAPATASAPPAAPALTPASAPVTTQY